MKNETIRIDKIAKSEKKAIISSLEKIVKTHKLPIARAVIMNYFKTDKARKKNQIRIKELQREIRNLKS